MARGETSCYRRRMVRRPSMLLVTLVLLSACREVPPQMEALEVRGGDEDGSESAVVARGRLAVIGADRDYELTVTGAETVHAFTVHSPGASELTRLSGLDVEVEVDGFHLFELRDVVIRDEHGPLYLGIAGGEGHAPAIEGAPLVAFGDVVARTREGRHRVAYHELRIDTDEGPVALLPGAVETVRVGGVPWRFAALSAWQADGEGGVRSRCATQLASLGYELLRMEAMDEPTWLERDPSRAIAREGCGW